MATVTSATMPNFQTLTAQIADLTAAHNRAAGSVRLVAVGKRQSVEKIAAVVQLGQRDLAENYVQEGLEKMAALRDGDGAGDRHDDGDSNSDSDRHLRWHFIGHIQSRKCKLIAAHFDWVHSVDNITVAKKLNQARAEMNAPPLQVLIQVNLDGEENKSGVHAKQLPALAEQIAVMPSLRLRGLMVIPAMQKTFALQRKSFRRCRVLRDELNARGLRLEHLSMGMSGDMEAAIAEGATMIRIGTALFGARG